MICSEGIKAEVKFTIVNRRETDSDVCIKHTLNYRSYKREQANEERYDDGPRGVHVRKR